MTVYGYARVSSIDQDLTIQENALRAAGCEIIRSEKISGTSRKGRSELRILLDFARKGDTIYVTRIDRLARCSFLISYSQFLALIRLFHLELIGSINSLFLTLIAHGVLSSRIK